MVTGLIDRTNRSLLPVTLAFAMGVGTASRGLFPASAMLGAIAFFAVFLLWAYFFGWPRLAVLLLLPCFFLTGLWHGAPAFRPPIDPHHVAKLAGEGQQDVVLDGFLVEAPFQNEDRTRLLMSVTEVRRQTGSLPAHGLVQLTVGGRLLHDLLPGDHFLARARVDSHRSYQVPGAMDYRSFLRRQGIWLTGWAETPLHILPVADGPPLPWTTRLRFLPERLRAQANRLIAQLAPPANIPLYYGLLTGSRSAITPEIAAQFQKTGATHLLAISGMNLGLVTLLFAGLATWLLKRSTWVLLHLPVRKIALLLALPPLLGYATITGLQPPAVRALIMVLVFVAAVLFDRQWCSLNNLAIAALLILALDPTSLLGASFQLSFAATAAIILAYRLRFPLLPPPQHTLPKRLGAGIMASLIISIIATLATAPLCLFYFNQVSLLSPITTLALTPLLCFWTIPLGLLGLALASPLPALASHLFTLGGWGITASLTVVKKLSALSWAALFLPTPTLFELTTGLAALLALLAWQTGRPARIMAAVLVAALLVSPLVRYQLRLHDQTCRVTFLDVGQGNAVVLELPQSKTVLVDGGGLATERFNVGERLIAPFLWSRGIATLDAVVVSHPHSDHWNGLPFIIKHFRPATLWVNGKGGDDYGYAALLAEAQMLGITIKVPQPGEVLCASGMTRLHNLASLHLTVATFPTPKTGRTKGRPDANNQSLVLQLRHGNHACLLPGDIDATHEKHLLREKGVESAVLLAPHHGSKHSSSPEFIAAVRPQTIVVSAQGGTKARFPHSEKRKMWQEMGIPVLITGNSGTIGVRMENGPLRVAPLSD